MTLLGLLLIALALPDLIHSVRPRRWLPELVGAGVVLLVTVGLGISTWWVFVLVGAVSIGWGQLVTWAFGPKGVPWVPLVLLPAVVAVGLALGTRDPAHGWLADQFGAILHCSPPRAVQLLGIGLLQLSTGNVLVRLVLATTGTLTSTPDGKPAGPETELKGGRLLGPMERIFILGLGMGGNLTAAAVVAAAKGLIRFPELQQQAQQERIHALTEYFLVGSFASWLVALAGLALTRF